jgi:hypothetical protein
MDTTRARISLLAAVAAVAAAVFVSSAAGVEKKDEDLFLPQEEYKASELRDPFQTWIIKEQPAQPVVPGGPVEPEITAVAPALNVQGVFWGASFPQAIINNTIVKEGDTVQNAKVLSITKDSIKFQFSNREFSVAAPASSQKGQ